ncbi:helix-turn-helix domain-containing protein [Hoyosella subflava]|uniref:Transcriptional regulator, AraC family n=1 Tax=Hoyosella subflava (strain DSM 45089 / JCM 17490 / NBRC 109087 / DQS3-9A1) TaxID=443218 RepID=F6EFJ9_HOYSD|nr:AraC family transcriptional regulator [Hoyosella subflava]AEF40928.1 Transcriptional regulator, AraC family [Hoyosella subflava DQS3-9A1]
MTELPRDRVRELLDAVLDDEASDRDDMARRVYISPFHFSRQFRLGTYESPVALRRRVILERAAWRLRRGDSVTDVALSEGYESVEGFSRAFSRAFGFPPSAAERTSTHWLPAPNGIHFHPPTSLWVDSAEAPRSSMDPTTQMVHHDIDDTRYLLELAGKVAVRDYDRPLLPRHVVLGWDGPEESIAAVLEHLIWSKEVWLASIDGADVPARGGRDIGALAARHETAAPRFISAVQRIAAEDRWGDVLIDALCDPPESFVLGSVISHVLTFSAYRRQVVRQMLRNVGVEADQGDPIMWLRTRHQPSHER